MRRWFCVARLGGAAWWEASLHDAASPAELGWTTLPLIEANAKRKLAVSLLGERPSALDAQLKIERCLLSPSSVAAPWDTRESARLMEAVAALHRWEGAVALVERLATTKWEQEVPDGA